ncbi:MAG: MiaB/RimO family radical SAM methylthiotransferase [Desulfobacterales bacterium]|nr:MiaB/RimO family radical SAM methylthiotransferase [Desulfobacterales bacterium]MBF0397270.1 MiaB/RimO family radical SAM methylthiotransferase [Desulfobacterales bacterium]
MRKFNIITLGCKVNQYESEAISAMLIKKGFIPVDQNEAADLCIINTCAVTGKASMQSRQALRKQIKLNPKAQVIATGCYAKTSPDEIKNIHGIQDIDILLTDEFPQIPLGKRTRPFLKIQDGCDAFCTYCIVPHARGRSRSMPIDDVISNIKSIKYAGYHEVVLSGIHLGRYGYDFVPKENLYKLLSIIEKLKLIDRVRLSSIEPLELSDDIIKIAASSDIICRHFHIPLQSGDDLILKRMNRPYDRNYFKDLVLEIHNLIPDASIGVDTLIGFPGETETAFENTFSLISELPISYLHVFPFSPRKGTPAFDFPNKISNEIIKDRTQKMRILGKFKKKEFYRKMIGLTVEALVEGKREHLNNYLTGITSNYIKIFIEGEDSLKNNIVKVKIDRVDENNEVWGQLV